MKKRLIVHSLALLLCLTAWGCAKLGRSDGLPPAAVETPAVETPAPTPTPYDGPVNPLTGQPIDETWVNKRPIAIMLNNIKEALPQLGVSQADIIYEALAEGGITRMLGVYQSVEGVGAIGSVRSARPYYLELALGHDAVYLHAGGSEDAYRKIRDWGVTALDCVNGPYEGSKPGSNLFWRDATRRKVNGYTHSVITTGETIIEKFQDYSFRQEHSEEYLYLQSFAADGTPEGGQPAAVVTVPFSNYKTGVFTYDDERGLYLVEEYGAPYIDGNSGEQVAVTNLIVIKTRCTVLDNEGRLDVDLTSGGAGWFACGGQMVEITWSKRGRDSQFIYLTGDGQPLVLGQGRSYVCIVPLNADVTAR